MTAIEWTHKPGTKGETLNPIRARSRKTGKRGWFCVHVNGDCANCYAENLNLKAGTSGGNGIAYKAQLADQVEVYLDEETLIQPLRWKSPRTIFLCSMTDLFGDWVKKRWLDRIFAVAALCPHHTFIVLTKRPRRMRAYFEDRHLNDRVGTEMADISDAADRAHIKHDHPGWAFDNKPEGSDWVALDNVWFGVSCGDQAAANEFIPDLLRTPAAVRQVSCEPMRGLIDLTDIRFNDDDADLRMNVLTGEAWVLNSDSAAAYSNADDGNPKLDWVIAGGESGPRARSMHPDWVRSVRDQCAAAGVPFFFKQWGEHHPSDCHDPEQHDCRETPDAIHVSSNREGRPAEAAFLIAEPGNGWAGMCRIGKSAAGRILDGRTHDAFPITGATP